MSQSLETVRRLQAWHAGKPLARGEVINVHVADDDDIYIVAFLRMGGESRPWGIACGTIADGPSVHTVPEGRNRTLVADLVCEWAPSLLQFFRHPGFSDEGPAAATVEPLRQVWAPGPSHIEMFQYLAAAYSRTSWDRSDLDTLRAVGNLANALFIESQRPGQQTIISATEALRRSFIFPTAPVRQGHLGHLLAWLDGGNTRDSRFAAAIDAEKNSVATVVNPDVERLLLQPHLAAWNNAQHDNDNTTMAHEGAQITATLEKELLRRWHLTKRSIDILRHDIRLPNSGLVTLSEDSRQTMYRTWGDKVLNEAAGVSPFWPNVFTDYSPRVASSDFHQRLIHDEKAQLCLLHGDKQLQQAEIERGHGLICTVTNVDAQSGVWTTDVIYPHPTACKVGDGFVIAGSPRCEVEVTHIDDNETTLTLRPSWKNSKKELGSRGLAPTHKNWLNTTLVLITSSPSFLGPKKAKNARERLVDQVDITDLINARPRRHGAFDDDGLVVPSGEEQ